MTDLCSRADIDRLLENFYHAVRQEEVLGPIFNATIPDEEWLAHLEKIGDFWETVLFQTAKYKGAPIPPHIRLDKIFPLEESHFNRWLGMFHQTIDALFTGEVAEEAKKRATLMAGLIRFKVESARGKGFVM